MTTRIHSVPWGVTAPLPKTSGFQPSGSGFGDQPLPPLYSPQAPSPSPAQPPPPLGDLLNSLPKRRGDIPQPPWPGKDGVLHDREHLRLLRNALIRRRAAARTDVNAFFEFVLREEHTRKPIRIAAHQRVGLDFMVSHDRSVNMWPVGHAKTFTIAGLTMFLLGQDPTARGAIVSATQAQAAKVLSMVRAYIESSNELQMVFEHMRRSSRGGDSWTQTAITIERPAGIRDPSLIAAGINGEGMPGSRLSWIVVDDVLTFENTATKDQRDRIHGLFDSQVLSRLDPRGSRIALVNTAWHVDDLLHRLESAGWPTMRMGVSGNIEVKTPPQIDVWGNLREDRWGVDDAIAPHIRPASSNPSDIRVRLTAHDPDPENKQTLWPDRMPAPIVERKRREHLPVRFNQLYENQCHENETARCKVEWIELCKLRAREIGHTANPPFALGLVDYYEGELSTYTGVDIAIQPGEENDDCALFTFAVLPSKHRLILDIQVGQWDGPTLVKKIINVHQRFKSIVRVENNAAQDFIRQFTLNEDIGIPIRAHTTGRNKTHPYHGIESMLVELSNGAWLIPNSPHGQTSKEVQGFCDACLNYSPAKHTSDVLMASWFAREQARAFGALTSGGSDVSNGNFGAQLMAR